MGVRYPYWATWTVVVTLFMGYLGLVFLLASTHRMDYAGIPSAIYDKGGGEALLEGYLEYMLKFFRFSIKPPGLAGRLP